MVWLVMWACAAHQADPSSVPSAEGSLLPTCVCCPTPLLFARVERSVMLRVGAGYLLWCSAVQQRAGSWLPTSTLTAKAQVAV
jgi:hypothetical protein